MPETNIIVARARIAGGVSLASEAPEHVTASAGSRIMIKLPFRFDDLSKLREDYEVTLAVTLDDEPEEVATIVGKDHPVLSDDKRGFVLQERTIVAPGDHHIHYRATVRLEVGGWDGGETQLQESEVAGSVRVTIS